MEQSRVVLGFCGRARGGKTTATDAIFLYARGLGLSVYVASFGELVCNYCVDSGALPPLTNRERATPEQLKIIVDVGMHCRQKYGDDFWLGQFDGEIFKRKPNVVLCPNIRMPNEVAWIRSMGGSLIRCVRLNPDGSEFISPDRDPNHITETATTLVNSDYNITVKDGQTELAKWIAVDIFEFERQKNARLQS